MTRHFSKKDFEKLPLSDNQAFDTNAGHYETFTNDSVCDIMEMTDLRKDDVDEIDEAFNESFEHDLISSLPSSTYRMVKNMSSADKLLQKDGDGAFNEADGSSLLRTNDITLQDMAEGEDNLVLHGLDAKNTDQLRDMTATLKAKKNVRSRVHKSQQFAARPVSGWIQFEYSVSLKYQRCKNQLKQFIVSFNIWNGHFKEIEGLFGTGVLAYFKFLRWLVYLNVLIMILMISFMFIPQMIHDKFSNPTDQDFTGIELLTGEGWFNDTKLYYGSYTNEKVNGVYNVRLAYLITGGGYLLLCVIILAASMARSYKQNYIVGGASLAQYSSKVFCSWDYGITKKETARLRMLSIAQDLSESLGSTRTRMKDMSCSDICSLAFLRLFMNIIVLALMAGSIYLIVFVSKKYTTVEVLQVNDLAAMIPAVVISSLNLVLPIAFRLIASVENYQQPKNKLQVTLVRTVVFKLASLVSYVVALQTFLTREIEDTEGKCWENIVGQAFYKLMIVDIIFTVTAIFFGEFIKKLLAKHLESCIGFVPGFDISRNVLDLIYSQGVCWLGTLYCPLLPVIHVIKLVLFFYVKKVSAVYNCRPPQRPFKASKMNVVFLGLLSLMLILSLVVMGYIINNTTLKPSKVCGPFQGEETIFEIVHKIKDDLSDGFKDFIEIVTSLTFIAVFLFLMGLLAYYFRLKKKSNEKKIKLLKHQLSLAGQDKQFLLAKLRQVIQENPHVN